MGNLDNLPFNLTDSLIYMQGLCEPTEWLNLDVWVELAETALFLQLKENWDNVPGSSHINQTNFTQRERQLMTQGTQASSLV